MKDSDQKLITKAEPNFKELKIFNIDGEKSFEIIVAVKANLEKDRIPFLDTSRSGLGSMNTRIVVQHSM